MKILDKKLVGQIWSLAWPTALYSLLQAVVGIVDLLMVGHIGSTAIAAVGMSRQIIIVVLILVLTVSTGATTIIAQLFGAGRRKDVDNAGSQAVKMMAMLSFIIGPLGFFLARPMLLAIGAEPGVLSEGIPYIRIYFATIIFMNLNFCVAAILLGAGDAKTPLKIALVVNAVNVLVNWLFIYGVWVFPKLGVPGAAVGTAAGRMVGMIIGLGILFGGDKRVRLRGREILRFDFSMMWRILRIGIPTALQGVSRTSARVAFLGVVATTAFATSAAASLSIGLQMRLLFVMPALAFQVTIVSLVGQSLGAGQLKQAERIAWEGTKAVGIGLAAAGVLMAIFARQVMQSFTGDSEVIEIGTVMIYYFCVSQIFSGLAIVISGGLTGAGMTRPAMWYTIICQWLITLPAAWFLSHHTSLGLHGAWIMWVVGPVLQFVLTARKFASGHWKSHRL